MYDYIMTVSHNQTYFEYLRYNQVVIDYFENYPLVPFVFWTINVFGGRSYAFINVDEKRNSVLLVSGYFCLYVAVRFHHIWFPQSLECNWSKSINH